MKTQLYINILFCLILASANVFAEDQEAKPRLMMDVSYYSINNEIPYVGIYTKYKIERKFSPAADLTVKVYLNELAEENLLGTIVTNKEGKGFVYFPPTIKALWDTLSEFTIIAETEATKDNESLSEEITLTKAKITIDTYIEDDIKNVAVKILKKEGNDWVPADETDTKIIIKRLVGNLSVGDEDFYTTDTTGIAIAEFLKEGLPGDKGGNLILIGKTEDNDLFGNISIEKKVNWGTPMIQDNSFDKRSLYATRDKAPLWLIGLAGSIVVSVWAVIFYLVFLYFKIRKIGKQSP